VSTYLLWHLQVEAPSGSSGKDHQLLRTSKVTTTSTMVATTTNTATTIDTATGFETATAAAT
jgi:hypothetical protein